MVQKFKLVQNMVQNMATPSLQWGSVCRIHKALALVATLAIKVLVMVLMMTNKLVVITFITLWHRTRIPQGPPFPLNISMVISEGHS